MAQVLSLALLVTSLDAFQGSSLWHVVLLHLGIMSNKASFQWQLDGWVMVERSVTMWSTGEGNGKPLQYSCLENPMNSMKRQNDRIPKEELPRSLGAQYATGDQCRNNSRNNEGMEPKQKQYPAVDVTGDRSKI